ncbi:methyl-accepting chemotaxis protein [Desulfoscipio geothermicus]|uniref:Methyl-accepting chemotaxis protein n=1 Tax=Desulfoscipio geothermicus DSM 3669 TaxID=1121426 RepID=A0A1I6DVU9_9FIRM|nr:methyl-accepting chemotaxis protein [Desulfoscipio geothermicus]SFR09624.1 methyl-accepting chemotaxis protein [Desulfoscipio geothermicus DSM 3669]
MSDEANFKKGLSLRFKLITFFVLVAVLPLLAGGIWSIINVKSELIKNTHHSNMLITDQIANQVDQLIKNRIDLAASLAKTTNVSKMDPEELKSLITPIKDYYPDIDVIGIIDKSGRQIVRSDDNKLLDLHDRSYFTEVMAGKEYSVSDVVISRSNGKPIVVIGTPIKKNGGIEGVFQISLILAGLDNILAASKTGQTDYSFITDSKGKVVAHPDHQIAAKRTDFSALAPVETAIKGQNKGSLEYLIDGTSWQSYYCVTPFLKWVVVTQQTTAEATAEANILAQNTLLVLALGALAAVLVGVLFSTMTIRPLNALKKELLSLAEGDLTQNVQVKSRDEIGELAHTFNKTVVQLRELIVGIKASSNQLSSHSQELASSSEEVSATIEEVAGTANEVAAISTQGAENAEESARESEQVLQVAVEGNQAVRQTIEKMGSISSASENVSSAIEKLSKQSNKIGEIINTITNIADQTNLLALNAAIEAARAGEHGRGFSVVAEEVRNLAEQSATAANEITDLIKEIQFGVEEAIRAMRYGNEEVSEGAQIANNAGASLEQIIKAIEKNIAVIKDVADGAKQINEGTQQLTAANEQITSTIQQVSGAAQELANIAFELRNRTERFKVNSSENDQNA